MASRPATFRLFWHRCTGPSVRDVCQKDLSSTWRSFVTSTARAARPAKTSPRNAIPGSNVPAGSVGRLALKVAREGDVVLFRSPSHRTYIISAYGLSAFCFAYALFNSNDVFRDAKLERPMWQKGLFGGICVTMSVMGTLFLVRTGHLVRSITAVKANNQPHIRFAVRRMIPFTKPYHFEVLPSQVAISRRLVISPDSRQRFEGDSKKIGSAQDSKLGFFKAPVQTTSVGLWKMFMSMRQIFTGEDFILLKVEGRKQTFRVDSNGYVAGDFMALGNPVKFERS
ncbi:hypothetical protein N7520_003920 [Penicillium odoratum]|uniref:uncharacterized protein n=1 Tax=Penicillium odoratum TaxID=1167516 RepID=UPI00254926E1|nr:uncharacterized protein N7520_003920 [Penicillium odoratum]KAJ5769361.1 hypothetical protein N7520_003920 [Penicillium odoratum]